MRVNEIKAFLNAIQEEEDGGESVCTKLARLEKENTELKLQLEKLKTELTTVVDTIFKLEVDFDLNKQRNKSIK